MFGRFRRISVGLALAVVVAASAAAAPALAAVQPAGQAATTPAVAPGPAAWGQPCLTVGTDGYTPGGTHLVCVQAKGDDCPRWHNPAPRKAGGGWVRPSTSPCPCDQPSGSPDVSAASSPAASPSVSVSAVVSPSAAASGSAQVVGVGGWANAGRLPVTGFDAGSAVVLGVTLIGAGVLLVLRRRRRRAVP